MAIADQLRHLDGRSVGGEDFSVGFFDSDENPIASLLVVDGIAAVVDAPDDVEARFDLWLKPADGHDLRALVFGADPAIHRARELLARSVSLPWAPHPPFDVDLDQQQHLALPNADVTIRHVCRRTLLGEIDYVERFIDGRLVDRGDNCDEPEVTVFSTFEQLTTAYDPALDSLTAVTGMRIECISPALVIVAAGLYEDRSFRGFLNGRAETNRGLSRLARIVNEHPPPDTGSGAAR